MSKPLITSGMLAEEIQEACDRWVSTDFDEDTRLSGKDISILMLIANLAARLKEYEQRSDMHNGERII